MEGKYVYYSESGVPFSALTTTLSEATDIGMERVSKAGGSSYIYKVTWELVRVMETSREVKMTDYPRSEES